MSAPYYRFLLALAATLSLFVAACSSGGPQKTAAPEKLAANGHSGLDTDATIWTVLGLAPAHPGREPGPKTGPRVNPILWQAARETLAFVETSSEDPQIGELATKWYSPQGKTDERFKIYVFVLHRSLWSNSVAVDIVRQQRSPDGKWVFATVDKSLDGTLQLAILRRAKEIRHKFYPGAE